MYNVVDEIVERADDLPLRKIKDLDLDHITLVVNKNPVYSATSVEVRAEEETMVETRASEFKPHITDYTPSYDNSAYKARVNALKK